MNFGVEPKHQMKVLLPTTWRELWIGSGNPMLLQPLFYDPITRCVATGKFEDAVGLACEIEQHLLFADDCPKLKVITFTGTGIHELLVHPKLTGREIVLCNVRDYASRDVAEHTVALLLALIKRVVEGDTRLRAGLWSDENPWGLPLAGLTIGILGLGSVGRQVVSLCRALDVETVYYSRTRDLELERTLGVTFCELDDVLERSDVISVHLSANSLNRHFLGDRELRRMKRGSYLLNTSRASLIDTEALVRMLSNGHLAGAGLDVFDIEPLPVNHQLLNLPNTLLSPHVAASTANAIRRARLECIRNLEAFAQGNSQNVVVPVEARG